MARTRTGLLIVRAWIEPASSSPLRARIRMTTNVALGFDTEVVVSDARGVCQAVEAWLVDVLAANPRP